MNSKTRLPSEPRKKAGKSALPGASFLRAELHRFQALGLGLRVRDVVWRWNGPVDKEGEVLDDVVYIYVRDRGTAVKVLRHELLHAELVSIQEPYVQLLNALLGSANEEAHRRAERLTEKLREGMEVAVG